VTRLVILALLLVSGCATTLDSQKYDNVVTQYNQRLPHKAMVVCLSSFNFSMATNVISAAYAKDQALNACTETCKDCQLVYVDFDQVYDPKSYACKKNYNTGMAVGVASIAAIGVMSGISGTAPNLGSVKPPPDSSYCNPPLSTSASSAEEKEELEKDSVCMAYATRTSTIALDEARQASTTGKSMQDDLKAFAQESVSKFKLSDAQVHKIEAAAVIAYANPNIKPDTLRNALYKDCKKEIRKQDGVYVE
jgi:hypothetical protein